MSYIQMCANILAEKAYKNAQTGGMHCAAVFDNKSCLGVFKDIGTHNALDKLAGCFLINEEITRDCLLITTGRISSDMARKSANLGATVVASFSTPTYEAYEIAKEANLTLISYIGESKSEAYNALERLN